MSLNRRAIVSAHLNVCKRLFNSFCKSFKFSELRKIQRNIEIFFMTFKFENIFFPIKNIQRICGSDWPESNGIVALRHVPGGLRPPRTVRCLRHNYRSEPQFQQNLNVLMGKKIFSNLKVIKNISRFLWIFLSSENLNGLQKTLKRRLHTFRCAETISLESTLWK
jgi:hypothetical protein